LWTPLPDVIVALIKEETQASLMLYRKTYRTWRKSEVKKHDGSYLVKVLNKMKISKTDH